MDEKRLQEIEERAAKASLGPWLVYAGCVFSTEAQANIAAASELHKSQMVQYDPIEIGSKDWREAMDNAEFIAVSRQDIPDLLAEVKRLRGELTDGLRYVNALIGAIGLKEFCELVEIGKLDGIRAWLELNGEVE